MLSSAHLEKDFTLQINPMGIVPNQMQNNTDGAQALGGDAVAAKVCAAYQEQVTCASCHSDVRPPGHDFLHAS